MSRELFDRLLTPEALTATAPLMALALGLLLLLAADIVPSLAPTRRFIFVATLLVSGVYQARILSTPPGPVFEGTYAATSISGAWGLLFLASTLVAWAFSLNYYERERPLLGEHDVLMLCSCMGMMIMAGAQDLLVFFLGLELLSIPLYALAAFRRIRNDSVEAGTKYFILGAFASALFLYGAALLYADTGTLSLSALRQVGASTPMALLGVTLIASSLFFKISVFPFHLWVPDVYQGSPTPVTTFMATGTKAAGFAFLLNVSFLLPASAVTTLAVIAILTMMAGNLGALVQDNLKRMLAYSGIAHAGTLLLVVTGSLAGDPNPQGAGQAAVYYMAAYVFTAGGAFGLIALLESTGERFTRLDALRGLAQRRPAVAAAMTLFMLSLGGIPATGGFLGKYLVFSVLVRADLIALAVIGILLSVVALGYYLRVIVAMYMQPLAEGEDSPPRNFLPATLCTSLCAAMVLALGVMPGWFLDRL